jgi:uncharacterized protein
VKLSREKSIKLSHVVLDYLLQDDGVEYFDEPQELRGKVFHMIEAEMRADEAIDALARRKIESQRRDIPEGSSEWEILYRKYYEEETAKHRKVMP